MCLYYSYNCISAFRPSSMELPFLALLSTDANPAMFIQPFYLLSPSILPLFRPGQCQSARVVGTSHIAPHPAVEVLQTPPRTTRHHTTPCHSAPHHTTPTHFVPKHGYLFFFSDPARVEEALETALGGQTWTQVCWCTYSHMHTHT